MRSQLNRQKIKIITILSDIFILNISFLLAYLVRYQFQWVLPVATENFLPYNNYLLQQIIFTIILCFTYSQNKVWRRRRGEFWIDELSRIGYATATGVALLMAITFIIQPAGFSRLIMVWLLVFTVSLVSLNHYLIRFSLTILYQRNIGADRALVVGSGEACRSVIRTLLARPDLGFKAIGYLDGGIAEEDTIGSTRIPHLGSWQDLNDILDKETNLHTVFITLPGGLHQQILEIMRICHRKGVQARIVPDLFELSLHRVEFNNMAGIPMFAIRTVGMSQWEKAMKRAVDLLIMFIGAIPTLLVSSIIALWIKLDSKGPILYTQTRVGEGGEHFKLYKFRSMIVNADDQKEALKELNEAEGPIFKIRDDPRLTRAGRIIRRLSLDELPQLYNVLRGDMSLVGPRPPLPAEVAEYAPWHHQRFAVKGGLTGLWQVSGRSDLTFDEQCLLDIYYIENWALSFDLRILLQTIPYTLFGKGAY